MSNLFGYGSTATMPMVKNCSLDYCDERSLWILIGKCEGCNVVLMDEDKELVIKKWKTWLMKTRIDEIEPDFV
jgi:hypothetical protein